MKRIIDHFLLSWRLDSARKPLLLRGARQVGKTFSVRQLGKQYAHFVEINLEQLSNAHQVFSKDLDPHRIVRELSLLAGKQIVPGKTLLFLDEVQKQPLAITALRYFYEQMPELHVIAAGSLLDFAIEQVGIPVGRVDSLFMHPVSFAEYLVALGHGLLLDELLTHNHEQPIAPIVHEKCLSLLGQYLAIGGMPFAVHQWAEKQEPLGIVKIQSSLLAAYRQDFTSYARRLQVKYVDLVFDQIPLQLGRKFKYSLIEGEYRKRELAPALDLLVTAGVAHKVHYAAGQGLPLGAQIDQQDYKVLFLDIGLAQAALQFDVAAWFLNPESELVNKGSVVEAFVGQELLAYGQPLTKQAAFYWHKETGPTAAEIDYLVQCAGAVVPVEVKAGSGSTLRSLHHFLQFHQNSVYGIRFSAQNYSVHEKVHSYPLYAIATALLEKNSQVYKAISYLLVA